MLDRNVHVENSDSVYYRDGVNSATAMGVMQKARQAIFELFMKEMKPSGTTRILDIGVSDAENEGSNYLEKLYPWPENITCAGIGTGDDIRRVHPRVKFQSIVPGEHLPFPDNSFDIAYSNAVIEHVGGKAQRREFIKEHCRVASAVFFTFPNRWFPIEHHTGVPLLHYWPALFRKSLSYTKYSYWTNPENLEFLGSRLLSREWPHEKRPKFLPTGLPLGFLSSNIATIYRCDGEFL